MADIVQTLTVPAILIEHVDRTRMTRATGSFRIEYQLGARGRADIEVRDVSSLGTAYRPGIDQTVQINPNLFSGAVFNVADAPIVGPHIGTLTRFQAMDNWRFAARRRVHEQFAAGTYDLWNFVNFIVSKYLAAYGITVDPAWPVAPGPVLGELVFDYSTVEDVFNRLAVLTSWVYRLTPANAVQWFPVGGKLRGITFSAANKNIIGPVQWTQTQGTFANRIILRYGTGLVDHSQDFVGDGASRAFQLNAPMAETGWIKYPGVLDQETRAQAFAGIGVAVSGGKEYYQTDYPALQEYQDTWPDFIALRPQNSGIPVDWGPTPFYPVPSGWIWDPPNHCLVHDQAYAYDQNNPGLGTITPANVTIEIAPYLALNQEGVGPGWKFHFDPAIGPYGAIVSDYPHPPRAGLAFTFNYKVQYPLVVEVEDAADIAVNGISEDLREEPTIFERQAAIDFANGLLRKQTKTPRTAHLSTRVASDFLPGDTVQLDIPSRTLPASAWLVTSVILSADVDQNLTTQLELLEGVEAQGSWIDFWRNMLGTGSASGQGIASGSVLPGTGGSAPGAVVMFLPASTNRLTMWAAAGSLTDAPIVLSGGGDLYVDPGRRFFTDTLGLIEPRAPVDHKFWYLRPTHEVMELQAIPDAAGATTTVFSVTRLGNLTAAGSIYTTGNVGGGSMTATGNVAASTFTGDAAQLTNLNATQLTGGSIPFARVPVSAASRLLGRGASGAGSMQEISLGTGLTMTGTVLSAATGSGTGTVTGPAASVARQIAVFADTTGKAITNATAEVDAAGNLTVQATPQATVKLLVTGNAQRTRLTAIAVESELTQNVSYDGANWNLDDPSCPGWLVQIVAGPSVDKVAVYRFAAGANPRDATQLFGISKTGDVTVFGTVTAAAFITTG